MLQIKDDCLPSSATLARELLEAATDHRGLQSQYTVAWDAAQVAKANATMERALAAHNAYVEGRLDAKNEQMRQVQLDALIGADENVRRFDQAGLQAQAKLKEAEGDLESAKVRRSALHQIAALRISENGVDVAGWQSGLVYDFNKGG